MKQERERPLSLGRRRFFTSVGLVTVVGLIAATAVSAVVGISYVGQGEVGFDKIKVIDSVKVMKSIQNPTSGKPVKVKDDFTVTGKTNALGTIQNTTPGKSVKIDDKLIVTGAANLLGVLRNTATDKPVKVADDLQVTGAFTADSITGLSGMVSAAGFAQSNDLEAVEDNVIINRNAIRSMGKYLDCVARNSQYTFYLESSDTLDCWNTWMAGTPIPPPLSKNAQDESISSDGTESEPSTHPSYSQQ